MAPPSITGQTLIEKFVKQYQKLDLCPICGEKITLQNSLTLDGRLIGTCQDAFTIKQWLGE